MRNLIKLFAAAALFAPMPVFAQSEAHRFTDRGVTFVYTVTPDAKGRRVIEGHRSTDGSRFRLVVDGDRVEGISGGQPVAFRAPKGGAVTVAAR